VTPDRSSSGGVDTYSRGRERGQLDQAVNETTLGRLIHWEKVPSARQSHPREDHLMPLLVAAGAAGSSRGAVLCSEEVMSIPMTSYIFGEIRNVT